MMVDDSENTSQRSCKMENVFVLQESANSTTRIKSLCQEDERLGMSIVRRSSVNSRQISRIGKAMGGMQKAILTTSQNVGGLSSGKKAVLNQITKTVPGMDIIHNTVKKQTTEKSQTMEKGSSPRKDRRKRRDTRQIKKSRPESKEKKNIGSSILNLFGKTGIRGKQQDKHDKEIHDKKEVIASQEEIDSFEQSIDSNISDVQAILKSLRHMALDMGMDFGSQNQELTDINSKASSNEAHIVNIQTAANKVLKK